MTTPVTSSFTPSERSAAMECSSTLAVLQKADALRRAGHDVIDLGPGEPDFPTPENIKEAAQKAIRENFTRYTPAGGTLDLKKAIIESIVRETGTRYEPQEVIVTAGGKQGIFNAIVTLIDPGDEVLIPAPYWVTFPEIVTFSGGRSVIIDTEPNSFQLTAEMVEAHLTPRSKLIILNSPSNPSGRMIDPVEFEKIAQLAVERGLWVLSDECYYQFTYSHFRPFSAASLAPELRSRILISRSFSKTYAMTGWRIGYALAAREWIDEMVKIQSHSTSNPSSIAQKAAIEAATGPQDSVDAMLAEYSRRRDYLIPALNALPGVECCEPEGAFYAFPSFKRVLASSSTVKSSEELAKFLLERAHVVLTAGSAFGSEGYVRISYATSLETLEHGIERIANCLKHLAEQ
jgi:aspartate aminotransferase